MGARDGLGGCFSGLWDPTLHERLPSQLGLLCLHTGLLSSGPRCLWGARAFPSVETWEVFLVTGPDCSSEAPACERWS